MSILGKSLGTLIKAANNGNIGAIDKLADSVSSFDASKIKTLARDKQQKAKKYTDLAKDMNEARAKRVTARNDMRANLKLFDDLIMIADEIAIKVAIENDVEPFTTAVVYKTPSEMVRNFDSLKKTFNALSTEIDDFAKIKKEYSAVILKVKNTEREATKYFKLVEQLTKKIEQLNTSIESLKN